MASPADVIERGSYGKFNYEVINPNSMNATVKIHIPAGESVKAIPGCMIATSDHVQVKGKIKKTVKALLGPDEARFQTLTALEKPGWVILAPGFYGSVTAIELKEQEICVGDDAFLAGIGELESTSKSQGLKKAMFSGSGLFVKKVKGTGVIFVCAVGSMMTWDLKEGESMIIDNGHMVTWPKDLKYDMQKASKSWFGSGVSGEGVVAKVTGPGKVNVQTRNAEEMAGWVYDSKMPPGGGGA